MVLVGRESVDRRWVDEPRVDLLFTLARVVPGTNVLAFIASTAYAIRGWAGAIAAILALCVPASCVIVLLTLGYQRWHGHPIGGAFITAAMSAIAGIIVGASWLIAAPKLVAGARVRTAILVALGLGLSPFLSPLTILIVGAAVGFFWPERA